MKQKNGKMGIALLGLGKYSTEQLAPALLETENCYLAGIVTGSPAKTADWRNKYQLDELCCYNYENFDTIKDNPAIDIVYVVTPNALHADFVVRAANAGKHVICEKPMSTTEAECDRMMAACAAAGVSLSVGYRLHFEPYNRQLMQLGKSHKLGYVQKLIAKDGLNGTDGWRLDKTLAGEGGPLMDVGIYCLQAANYIYDLTPIAVTAQQEGETINFQLEYAGGYTADCACSYEKEMNELHVTTNNGWFELQPAFGYTGIKGRTSLGELHFTPVNQQALEMDSIAKAILAGKPSPVPAEMGKQDVKILHSIYEALQSGARILLHPQKQESATNETGGAINGVDFTVQ